jgi:hypothetical protein
MSRIQVMSLRSVGDEEEINPGSGQQEEQLRKHTQ